MYFWTLLSYLCSFQRWKSRYDHVWILDLYIYFYLSGIQLCIEPLYAVVAIVVFLLVLKISKYVSLSSISTALIVLCITPFLAVSITAKLCMLVAVILLVYRHKDNIKRIKNHTESKIQWM